MADEQGKKGWGRRELREHGWVLGWSSTVRLKQNRLNG